MSFLQAISRFWKGYFDFRGRAGRREYWLSVLFVFVVALAVSVAASAMTGDDELATLFQAVWTLATFVPLLSVAARRLRDAGFSPFLVLIGLIPLVGFLVLLGLCLAPSKSSMQQGHAKAGLPEISIAEERESTQASQSDSLRLSEPVSSGGDSAGTVSEPDKQQVGFSGFAVNPSLAEGSSSSEPEGPTPKEEAGHMPQSVEETPQEKPEDVPPPPDDRLEAVLRRFPAKNPTVQMAGSDYKFFERFDELAEQKLMDFEDFKDDNDPEQGIDRQDRAEYKETIHHRASEVVDELNTLTRALENQVSLVLDASAEVDDFLSGEDLKRGTQELPEFDSRFIEPAPQPEPITLSEEPVWEEPRKGVLAGLPIFSGLHQKSVDRARKAFEAAQEAWKEEKTTLPERQKAQLQDWIAAEEKRKSWLEFSRQRYQEKKEDWLKAVETQNRAVDKMIQGTASGDAQSVEKYFSEVLSRAAYPKEFRAEAELAFDEQAGELVVRLDLPNSEVLDRLGPWKYQKGPMTIGQTKPTAAQTKKLYSDLIAQLVVRTGHEVSEANRSGTLRGICVDAHLTERDPLQGKDVRILICRCVASAERWAAVAIKETNGLAALKALKGEISANPVEKRKLEPKGSIGTV